MLERKSSEPDGSGNADTNREQEVTRVIDVFLLERANDPALSTQGLIDRFPHLMPELGDFLARIQIMDAARQDASAIGRATLDTIKYTGSDTSVPGLHVRCPHCCFQIEKMTCSNNEYVQIKCVTTLTYRHIVKSYNIFINVADYLHSYQAVVC